MLTDVPLERPLARQRRNGIWAFLPGALAAVFVIASMAAGLRPVITAIITPLGIFASSFFVLRAQHRRGLRRLSAVLDHAPRPWTADTVGAALDLIDQLHVIKVLRALTSAAVPAEQTGQTWRAARTVDLTPIAPLVVEFEPQPLNEAQSRLFQDTHAAGAGAAQRGGAWRGLDRALRAAGGWRLALIYAVVLLCNLPNLLFARWPTLIFLAAMGVAIFGQFFVRGRRGQWFLVPGGIVWRRAGWRQRDWRLHLFDRRTSVLLVAHHWQASWLLCVADANETGLVRVTQPEAEFALRAWLSPLTPPPVEQLTDLT